jgi:putative endonuclease
VTDRGKRKPAAPNSGERKSAAPNSGAGAEAAAAAYLEARGLRVRARNWRCRFGELDLVCEDGGTLVFVEVRARMRSDFGGAAGSITAAKRARLTAAARQYLAALPRTPPCRFDCVLVSGSNGNEAVEWLPNAFDAAFEGG